MLVPLLAQADEGTFPEDSGARVVFVLVGIAIVGLYFLLRNTRRRTEQAYWDRRRKEEERRATDPDMRKDDP